MKHPMLIGTLLAAFSGVSFAGQGTYVYFYVQNNTASPLKFKWHNHDSSGGSFIHIEGHHEDTVTIQPSATMKFHTHIYADTMDSPGDMHFYPENTGDSGGITFNVSCSNSGSVVPETPIPCAGCEPLPYKDSCLKGESPAPSDYFWGLNYDGSDYKSSSGNSFSATYEGKAVGYGTYIPADTDETDSQTPVILIYD